MFERKERIARIAYSYLVTDITQCEFITTDPICDRMCYKVYAFTPGGILRMDTGIKEFIYWGAFNFEAISRIKYLLNRTDEMMYSPWPLQSIIDNWKRFGLRESRVLEKKLIELWDGHPLAKKSPCVAPLPVSLRIKLMKRRWANEPQPTY